MSLGKRNPLEPFKTVLGIAGAILVLLTASIALDEMSPGDRIVCADAGAPVTSSDELTKFTGDLAPGVQMSFSTVILCDFHASTGQRALSTLTVLPTFLLAAGLLLLFHRLTRSARREGPFSPGIPRRLRLIGWFLIVGGFLTAVVETWAKNAVLAGLTRSGRLLPPESMFWLVLHHLSPGVLLAGVGLLTVARIFRLGVEMRAELDVTI